MRTHVTADDEGKAVVYDGETVARVVEIEEDTAYVDPDPGVTETVTSKLGWAEADEESVPLHDDTIQEVTDDEVRIDVAE